MIKQENYVVIPGWAVTNLKLKGNQLLIFSIIYGFCQDEGSCFNGSLAYLQEWTNSTRQGVINTLKTLINLNLIYKENNFPNNRYFVNKQKLLSCKKCLHDSKQSLHECKHSLQNTIEYNKDNIIENNNTENTKEFNSETNSLVKNNYINNKHIQEKIDQIVEYMNCVFGTKFRSNSSGTKKHIKARLKEGYEFEAFKDVIDFKWQEWGKNPVKFSTGQMSNTYLRPSTLFGTKFEEYLQAAWMNEYKEINPVNSVEKSKDRSKLTF